MALIIEEIFLYVSLDNAFQLSPLSSSLFLLGSVLLIQMIDKKGNKPQELDHPSSLQILDLQRCKSLVEHRPLYSLPRLVNFKVIV